MKTKNTEHKKNVKGVEEQAEGWRVEEKAGGGRQSWRGGKKGEGEREIEEEGHMLWYINGYNNLTQGRVLNENLV